MGRTLSDEARSRRGGGGGFRIPIISDLADGIGEQLGIATGAEARDQEAQAAAERQRAEDAIAELGGQMPTVDELSPTYQMEQVSPDMLLGPSQAADARSDPWTRQAQMRALAAMQEVYQGKGLTEADRLAIRQGNSEIAQQMRGQREAVMANAQERGFGGGGAELAALLTGAQGGANAMASQHANIQQAAQQRALQAMQAAGGLGSQARGQSFAEAYNRGQAADAFNRSNVDYRRGVQSRNVGHTNQGADRRADAYRDRYGMRERMAAMQTGQYNQQSEDARQREEAARKRQAEYWDKGLQLLTGTPGGSTGGT